MKKVLIYMCTLILGLSTAFTVPLTAAEKNTQKISVFLNGELIIFPNQQPTVVERRTLIPLRGIFEKMGYDVSWDAKTKSCVISNDIQTITMRSGHKGMQVNDSAYMLDVPAQIINDSLMIPLRAVAECTGATVTWDAPTKAVYINSNQKEQVTYNVNQFVVEYMEIIDELEDADKLFSTLNSLTDKNYSKMVNTLKNQSERAKVSLSNVHTGLSEMTVPDEYEELQRLSLEAVENGIELCELVDRMIDNELSYDEAAAEIKSVSDKASKINNELNNAMAGLNLSLYR